MAIDYDVVIKGLEKKFGEKTEENEREFRSFFDKIIQVPFSMPVGSYDIDKMLKIKFNELGIILDEGQCEDYIKVVKLTVGYIPRSIKRFINSFSLLKNIRAVYSQQNITILHDFCLFALLGIQISYPHIFRLINRQSDFIGWNNSFASSIGIDAIKVPDEDHYFLDEEWEQILWCYCQKDSYLRARAMAIIEVLNFMRSKLGAQLSEILDSTMDFASMTSVDDSIETKQPKIRGAAKKDDEVTHFFEKVRIALFDLLEKDYLPHKWSRWAGVGKGMRYFHFWYNQGFWQNYLLNYGIFYIESGKGQIKENHFQIHLGVANKLVSSGTISSSKYDEIKLSLKQINLPGFSYAGDNSKASLEVWIENDSFSNTNAQEVAKQLSDLITKTKDIVDNILAQ